MSVRGQAIGGLAVAGIVGALLCGGAQASQATGPAAAPQEREVAPPSALPAPDDVAFGAHWSVLSRNFSEHLEIRGAPTRDAWIQGVQVGAGATAGNSRWGVGVSATLFGALKLNGGRGARNMVHLSRQGVEQDDRSWFYPGLYLVSARVGDVSGQYGLQSIVNPFIQPYDNRALPPTFRALTLAAKAGQGVTLSAGRVDAVMARGYSHLQGLSSAYGGKKIERLDYLGGDWQLGETGKLALYGARASDVWDQAYLAFERDLGRSGPVRWSAKADLYASKEQGAALQGAIDNSAYSVALRGRRESGDLWVSYQRILGDQFFDFVQETTGSFLANSGGADYNAPHERSLRLKLSVNEKLLGMRGWQASVWAIAGWGADGSAEARRYPRAGSLMHDRYWKAGRPQQGSHHEIGFRPSFSGFDGKWRGAVATLSVISHRAGDHYPIKSFMDYRLSINIPLRTN